MYFRYVSCLVVGFYTVNKRLWKILLIWRMFTKMYLSFSLICGLYCPQHKVRPSVSLLEGSINVGEFYFGKLLLVLGFPFLGF